GADFLAIDRDNADQFVVLEHRHSDQSTGSCKGCNETVRLLSSNVRDVIDLLRLYHALQIASGVPDENILLEHRHSNKGARAAKLCRSADDPFCRIIGDADYVFCSPHALEVCTDTRLK